MPAEVTERATVAQRRVGVRQPAAGGTGPLGIDTQGRKHVLGLRAGTTETAAVSTALLNDLVTRGLPTDRAMLFLIDGAAAPSATSTGSLGVVQRCQFSMSGLCRCGF